MTKNCFVSKYAYILCIMLCVSGIAKGQQGQYNTANWRFSNPRPFGFTVLDVDYFDNTNVIAVGSDGGIAKSTNSGMNWTYGVFTFTNSAGLLVKPTFNDVHYVSATVAYAVGTSGCMAKTVDGGNTWSLVVNPLYGNQKSINAVWFTSADVGYIGGTFNTPDSLPKLYVTRNGGTTWDSLAAPAVNGLTRIGYINNPNLAPIAYNVDAKAKDIYSIQFINDSTGYVCGSASPLFPGHPAVNTSTCLPNNTNTTSGAHTAALLWKVTKNGIVDYSLSKERLGYTGVSVNPVLCSSRYSNVTPSAQTYRAMNIVNDSTVVLMSFNNNTVVRVNTGKNDSTLNVNIPGRYEKGKYIVLNFPFPPLNGTPIPNPQVLLASNPYHMVRNSAGQLFAAAGNGNLWVSSDTGRNWVRYNSLPQGQNYSASSTWAFDIAPNGNMLSMGSNGVYAFAGGWQNWTTNYNVVAPAGGYAETEFADCNNGMTSGSSSITVTTDGGKSWIDRGRPDFAASFYNINGQAYPNTGKAYFAVSNGVIYKSTDQAVTLDPAYSDFNYQMNDVAGVGNDTVYAVGYSAFSVPTASRKSTFFRSYNSGNTWQAVDIAVTTTTPAFTAPTISQMAFPSRLIGYVAGSRNAIYKTTDGGTTWTSINPFPALNQFPTGFPNTAITYTDIQALDNNTVFVVGNMFTNASVRRVYRSQDGGASWVDITGNIAAIAPVGNLNGVLFHDVNNGYVVIPGGALLKTNNGGAGWTLDMAPTGMIFNNLAFAPRAVPAGVSMANRKLFISGLGVASTGAAIMEYGDTSKYNVSSTEALTVTCDNTSQGGVVITPVGGVGPYTFSVDGGSYQPSNSFTGLAAGNHTISVKDAFCGLITKTVTIGVKPHPVVYAGADVTILQGDFTSLAGSSTLPVQSFVWTPTTGIVGSNTGSLAPLVQPAATTTYTLTVTATNGCVSSDNVNVNVLPDCIKVLDAFTPNGDGLNDRWIVTNNGGTCARQVHVRVFNRYGNIVYENANYTNNWDGTFSGKAVPDGTYYYIVEYTLINGRKVAVKGNVTILR